MSKPIQSVRIQTIDERTAEVEAVFDRASLFTIVRESALPPGSPVLLYPREQVRGTASQGGTLRIRGETYLAITIGDKLISAMASVSPDLARDLIIGAREMQAWDISMRNENGRTTVDVPHDLRDPKVTEVL